MRRRGPTPSGFASGPALALRNIKRCVYEGGQLPLDEGLELEGESRRGAVPLAGRKRGPHGLRREADPDLHRSMTTETITSYSRRVHRRRRAPQRAVSRCPSPIPADRPGVRRGRRRHARRRRRRRAVGRSRVPRLVGPRGLQARRDPRPGGSPRRAARRRARPAAHARAGQDAARCAHRDHEGDRHADALRRALEGAARRAHARTSTRASMASCCAGRSAWSARSCRGTSRRRCSRTSWRPRSWRATRSSRSRPERRR